LGKKRTLERILSYLKQNSPPQKKKLSVAATPSVELLAMEKRSRESM
jgi:hypothetical protein